MDRACSRESYNAVVAWLTDARSLASPHIVVLLVGNKKDLEAERDVPFLEASRFAQENGPSSFPSLCSPPRLLCGWAELMFVETSALTGECVEEGFLKCARTILAKLESGTSS